MGTSGGVICDHQPVLHNDAYRGLHAHHTRRSWGECGLPARDEYQGAAHAARQMGAFEQMAKNSHKIFIAQASDELQPLNFSPC